MRALIVTPGRGSYDRDGLGQLQGRAPELLAACDAYRVSQGRRPITELDAADKYRAALHVAGENASLLTFACTLADFHDLADRYEPVGFVGNSMGFYSALALSGALSLEDAITLVDTMGAYQTNNVIGGQVLYPLTDGAWRDDAEQRAVLEATLEGIVAEGHVAEWSIELGGYAVLGADTAGIQLLKERLPPVTKGPRTFPLQLPMHSAFHTSLMRATSERALRELGDLAFRAPTLPLIDGRGHVFRPHWTDPEALREYTLGHQVYRPFDFTTAVHTALQYCAPDVVIALGPGNGLGGPLARTLVKVGWRGHDTREAFEQADPPVLRSFGVPDQRAELL